MYRVFPVKGGYQIFWCPHYNDKDARTEDERFADARPSSKKIYPQKQGAQRRKKQLNDALSVVDEMIKKDGAIII